MRRVLILCGAVGFCVTDWFLDRLAKQLSESQEPAFDRFQSFLDEPLTSIRPWETP